MGYKDKYKVVLVAYYESVLFSSNNKDEARFHGTLIKLHVNEGMDKNIEIREYDWDNNTYKLLN